MSTARDSVRLRRADLLAVGVLVATLVATLAAFRVAPDRVQVHWSGGFENAYWGVRTLPKAVGLSVVPALAAGAFVALRALALVPGIDEEIETAPLLYDAVVVLVVATLCVAQVGLLLLNLG